MDQDVIQVDQPAPFPSAVRTWLGCCTGQKLQGTCQYPLRRSNEENQDELDTKSRDSSMQGNG